jgi:hypothetical protein
MEVGGKYLVASAELAILEEALENRPTFTELASLARGGGLWACPYCDCRHFRVTNTWQTKDGVAKKANHSLRFSLSQIVFRKAIHMNEMMASACSLRVIPLALQLCYLLQFHSIRRFCYAAIDDLRLDGPPIFNHSPRSSWRRPGCAAAVDRGRTTRPDDPALSETANR